MERTKAMTRDVNAPKISIIVPAFNAEKCLARCVQSVLNQVFSDYELIIIDDGSTDGTGVLADTFASCDSRIRVFHQENEGLSGARNTGIEHARGSRLYFLDSDDYIDKHALLNLNSIMDDNDCSIVIGGFIKVDEQDRFISKVKVDSMCLDELGYWRHFVLANTSEDFIEYIVSWGKLFDSKLFKSERFDLGKIHEDEFIIHRLISLADKIVFAYVDDYFYVQTSGSIMHSRKSVSYIDRAEALLERAFYFEGRGWFDLSFFTLCLARGSIALYIENSERSSAHERYRALRKQWLASIGRVSHRVPGNYKKKIGNYLFVVAPSLYVRVKGIVK